jgi:hypothetical protein
MNMRLFALSVSVFSVFVSGSLVFAETTEIAQTEIVQSEAVKQATRDVEDSVDALVDAKDDEVDDLALRINAFKKVVDLSITEATDLKVQLVLHESHEADLVGWSSSTLARLNSAVRYFKAQQKLDFSDIEDVASIKSLALDFKKWRDKNYVSLTEEVNDFLLLEKGSAVLAIAHTRTKKIDGDLIALGSVGIKGLDGLRTMLVDASRAIERGALEHTGARALFLARYVDPLVATSSSSHASSTDEVILGEEELATSTVQVSATTTAEAAPEAEDRDASIKDLITASFTEVKDAYRIFIEMSSLVRKLL